ncbi:27870_t:CDS:1, partial [Racocetra persica]
AAGAKIRNRLNYFKETIVYNMKAILPQERSSYSELLIEMLSDKENLNNIKDYVKNLKVFPNENYELYVARDLNDRDHPLLKLVYSYSNRFLPKCIQENQQCLKVLEQIGFVRNVTPDIFIKCAKHIQELHKNREDDMIEIDNLRHLASDVLYHFYRNQSTLKFSEDELEELSKIKFVPFSKSFLKYPYTYSSNMN